MVPGLVSITFREFTPEKIISLCQANNLHAIEWGGDIHVPHGDLDVARQVGDQTREAGLSVSAYGSYYRLASSEGPGFSQVLASAVSLGSPVIRVWAGGRSSADADPSYRLDVREDALCGSCRGKEHHRGIRAPRGHTHRYSRIQPGLAGSHGTSFHQDSLAAAQRHGFRGLSRRPAFTPFMGSTRSCFPLVASPLDPASLGRWRESLDRLYARTAPTRHRVRHGVEIHQGG